MAYNGGFIPNTFAYVALVAWPLISLVFFSALNFRSAIILTIFCGYLTLPEDTRLAVIMHPDKSAIISLSICIGYLFFSYKNKNTKSIPFLWAMMIIVFILSPFVTAAINSDAIRATQNLTLPGLTYYDGAASAIANVIAVIPFIIGMKFFSDTTGHRQISKALIVSMLFYSVLVILEIRISPQLHRWVYGFYPFSFAQSMRVGGFRSSVFLKHGLVLALFVALAFISAAVSIRDKVKIFKNYEIYVALYLLVILILEKSFGALILSVAFLAISFLSSKKRIYVTAAVSAIIIFYPILRAQDILPVETINKAVGQLSIDRQGSFQYRLDNEEILLHKARLRPFFGWGSWGRNRVFSVNEDRDVSVTDGMWIIQIGSFGWVGYICLFGLLCFPLWKLVYLFNNKFLVPFETSKLALLLTLNLCDLIPNSSLTPVTWLMAGALAGTYRIAKKRIVVGDLRTSVTAGGELH